MESTPLPQRQFRILVALLSSIAVLLAALVLALVLVGIRGARAMAALSGGSAHEAASELTQRQQSFEHELSGVSEGTLADVEALSRRRAALEDRSGGPLKKLDTTIQLNQLMADELLVLLKNLTHAELSVARGARPLPEERRARGISGTRRSQPPARR